MLNDLNKESTIHLPDIAAGDRQIGSALVEAQILDLVTVIKLDCLKVLQLSQIPQLNAGIICSGGQVVTVLREGDGRNGTGMTRKVGHIALLLQIPDLNLRVHGARTEDQTIRWNCAVVSPTSAVSITLVSRRPVRISENAQCLSDDVDSK